jgi:hypothetical protein
VLPENTAVRCEFLLARYVVLGSTHPLLQRQAVRNVDLVSIHLMWDQRLANHVLKTQLHSSRDRVNYLIVSATKAFLVLHSVGETVHPVLLMRLFVIIMPQSRSWMLDIGRSLEMLNISCAFHLKLAIRLGLVIQLFVLKDILGCAVVNAFSWSITESMVFAKNVEAKFLSGFFLFV